mgnify:CR=1 FL=1
MAVPGSGTLSMKGIFSEKNENDYTAANMDGESNLSLRGLSSNSHSDTSTGGNINLNSASASNPPNQTAPYSMSEFYSYDHDYAAPQASWTYGTTSYDTGTNWAMVSGEGASSGSSLGKVISQINLTWGSNGLAWSLVDDHVNCNVSSSGDETSSSGMSQAFAITNFNGGCTKVEVRWRVVNGISTVHTGSGNKITANYHRSGSQSLLHSGNRDLGTNIATSSQSSFNFTDSWRDVSPSAMGGSYSNSQSYSIAAEIGGTGSSYEGDDVRLRVASSSSNAIYFDIRLTKQNGTTTTKSFFKNYTAYNDRVDIYYEEFEIPDFTCIMPDMIVNEQTKGYIRIGDIVVGDRILAQGSLTDDTALPQYVEVTEARTHTRSGYWDVEGIHITNDHPVWLDHNGTKGWVNVEDMWDGITRNYVAGTVDPVYLGTNPGWYYVWSADRTKGFTVSGDYAPTTE